MYKIESAGFTIKVNPKSFGSESAIEDFHTVT